MIYTLEEAIGWADTLHKLGNTVVLTGGYFDPVHAGHIRLFKHVPTPSRLIVAVNGDEAAIKKKGYVFLPIYQRLEILNAMKFIDILVVNPHSTMCSMIETIKPNIYAKGGDVTQENLIDEEKISCDKVGCKIIYNVGGSKIESSSELVKKSKQKKSEWEQYIERLEIRV